MQLAHSHGLLKHTSQQMMMLDREGQWSAATPSPSFSFLFVPSDPVAHKPVGLALHICQGRGHIVTLLHSSIRDAHRLFRSISPLGLSHALARLHICCVWVWALPTTSSSEAQTNSLCRCCTATAAALPVRAVSLSPYFTGISIVSRTGGRGRQQRCVCVPSLLFVAPSVVVLCSGSASSSQTQPSQTRHTAAALRRHPPFTGGQMIRDSKTHTWHWRNSKQCRSS